MYLSKYSLFSEDPCPSSCFLPFFPCHWWYSGKPTLTYQYWPYTTSSPPNSNSTASQAANQSFLVTFFCVAVITRGSWRSNSCRPILSWRPLEMLRPSKMTTPQDLWVLWRYRTHCLDVFLVIFFARMYVYVSHCSFISLTGKIHPHQLWRDRLHCWSQHWDLYPFYFLILDILFLQ